jgi:hypothetical protein
MSRLDTYLSFGLGIMNGIKERNEEWKERILRQWDESKNLSRKKKKAVRKGLLIEWSIASWNPFEL